MILKFGAKNFYSFKEGFEVDLTLNRKNSEEKNFINVLAIKGANASGKTNVLKALDFIGSFVKNSFSNIKPDKDIIIYPYFKNDDPIEMFIIFLKDDIEYKYELSLTRHRVLSERIYKKEKRWTKIIWRDLDKIDSISEFKEIKNIKLRSNVSFFSMALQYDIEYIKPLANLFNISANVTAFGRNEHLLDYNIVSEIYYENEKAFDFMKNILKNSDTGIYDIKIFTRLDEETNKTIYFPIFEYIINGEIRGLTYNEQSSGTKSLYSQLIDYYLSLVLGKALVLDEFDVNLHPDLLPMLVELFESDETNKNNAQLIFTTHHTEIMNKLGKYRIVLVNKQNNESFLYRLDEIPGDLIRNDRPITPIYNSGKIGGKPKITL